MLVLSRKPGERVFLGEDIQVTILEVRGNQVKLGLTAPPYIPIYRPEIQEKMAGSATGTLSTDGDCWSGQTP